MGFPLCHMLVDDNDNLHHLVFVKSAGNPVGYYFDGDKVVGPNKFPYAEKYKNIFDTAQSAIGYMSSGSQATLPLHFESLENVDKNEFDSILKRLAKPKKTYKLDKISKVRVADNG